MMNQQPDPDTKDCAIGYTHFPRSINSNSKTTPLQPCLRVTSQPTEQYLGHEFRLQAPGMKAVADILHTSGIVYTAKESQIPAHVDSRSRSRSR
jgi:hypothetical protein